MNLKLAICIAMKYIVAAVIAEYFIANCLDIQIDDHRLMGIVTIIVKQNKSHSK